jgi:predicted AlkP superfamily pyrophosphatase or phosphodiesterase
MKALLVVLTMAYLAAFAQVHARNVDLVLQITVDQLRGDFPLRFKKRFKKGGFRYLMDKGVVYTNAHFQHAITLTAIGHGTLFTGGNTAEHGMAGNEWYDRKSGKAIYCVEDDRHGIIGAAPESHIGVSPRNLTSTTIGDELVLATGGKSRIFGVSIKDRGAVIPAGHLGKAYWYDIYSGKIISSSYYYDAYPPWVDEWNAGRHTERFLGASWRLLNDRRSYVYGHMDERSSERPYKHLGRSFPHPLGGLQSEDYYSGLRFTPMGDELTLAFAMALIEQERLGQGGHIDLLSISFSATDYIGHTYGPHSLEYEDNILRLDRTLAKLFGFIDQNIGLNRVLIALSSDHGVDAIPEHMIELGFDAGRLYPDELVKRLDAALQKRYESNENFVVGFWSAGIYLNLETIKRLGMSVAEVEQAASEEILEFPGIAVALTRSDLLAGKILDTPIMNKVQRAFHPKRSGNVILVPKQFWTLFANTYAAMHGSPYSYDTYVPIMLAGPNISPQVISRAVGPEDIAPTIAAYLGIKPPSGSVGGILHEVWQPEQEMKQDQIRP